MIRRIFNIGDAMDSLRAGASYIIRSSNDKDDKIEWLDTKQTQPTTAELDTEVKRLQAEYDSQEYARKRAQEYPDLAEQLDLLWHAIDTDTLDNKDYRNKFYTRLKKVKEDNPKG